MDDTMSPKRALTIAIKKVIDEDIAQGYHLPDPPTHVAAEAARLAFRIHDHMPEGWAVIDEARLLEELKDLEQRVSETGGALKLLLAFRLQKDGHAPTLGAALTLAEDLDRVREIYPQV